MRRDAGNPSPGASAGQDLHSTVVENLFDGVYYVDRNRTITYWNPAAARISGFEPEEVVGRRCFDDILGHVDDAGTRLCFEGCPLVQAMAQRRGVDAEVFLHHRDGHRVPVHVRCQPVRDEDGAVVGAVEIFNEDHVYREALRRITDLELASSTDAVTGIRNRRSAELAISSRLREAHEAGWPMGLLFVDIDHFKRFNDAHGHEVGDAVLRTVARSISSSLREADLVARWGGEEFVVLTTASNRSQIETLAARIRAVVAASDVDVGGERLGVTVSIGATRAAVDDTPATLVGRADRAMYMSKTSGRNLTTYL
jgi:diguanylate cyclase (GGDEF)-like protein/PAS domain S-box-containing protein